MPVVAPRVVAFCLRAPRLSRRFLGVAAIGLSILAGAAAATAEPIRGAGSTFAAPIVTRWGKLYETARADGGEFVSPDWRVDYEPVGSLAGVLRLDQPELDFAVTDAPWTSEALAARKLVQFPIVFGGVAVAANLDLGGKPLQLNGATIARIFSGALSNWSDPALRALNPDVTLPDLPIRIVHRSDGSGTTFAFTQYLSAVDADWAKTIGADTRVRWPKGEGAEGSGKLVAAVRATKGAVGYVEAGQAARAGLTIAAVQNRAGRHVMPEAAGIEAAVLSVNWAAAPDFFAQLPDAPGEATYPIAAGAFAIVPPRSAARAARVFDLFRLAFEKGGEDARALGYVPAPPPLVAMVTARWASLGR